MKSVVVALFSFLLAYVASAQTLQPLGVWVNEEGEAHFEIYKCKNNQLCGKITWLKEPLRDGKPKTDTKNPEADQRSRPIMGMVIMQGFEHEEGNRWHNGTIYDPKSGKTYSCNLHMLNKDKMEVRGYIGFSMIGRSQTWTRVQ